MLTTYPKVIVITGLPGAGKTYFSKILLKAMQDNGLTCSTLYADKLAKECLEDLKNELSFLPKDCFQNDILDRKKLRAYLLYDKNIREKLESVIHPCVRKRFESLLDKQTAGAYVIYELPLLFEKEITHPAFFKTICIIAKPEIIKKRLRLRGLSDPDIEAMLKLHLTQDQKTSKSNLIIDTSEDLREESVQKILKLLL